MAKQSTHKLAVTADEFTWIQGTIARKHTMAQKNTSTDKRLRTHVAALADKTSAPPEEMTDDGLLLLLKTNRNDLRILQELLKAEHAALVTIVAQEYIKRIEATHDATERTRLKGYYDRTTKRADVLLNLLNKVEGVLER